MNAAFFVVFALFVVAMIGLAVMAVRWGVRRDRAALAARSSDATSDVAAESETTEAGRPGPSTGDGGAARR